MSVVMSLVNKLLGNRQVWVQVLRQCGRFPRSKDRVLDTQREIFCSGLCLRSSSSLTDLVLSMITGVGMCLHHPHPALWLAACFQSVGSAYWISSQGSMGFVCRSLLSVPPQSPLFLRLYLEPLLHRSPGLLLLCTQSSRTRRPLADGLDPFRRVVLQECPAASALEKLGPDRNCFSGNFEAHEEMRFFFPTCLLKDQQLVQRCLSAGLEERYQLCISVLHSPKSVPPPVQKFPEQSLFSMIEFIFGLSAGSVVNLLYC